MLEAGSKESFTWSSRAVGCGRSEDSKRNASVKALVETWNSRGASADYKFVATDPFWSQELPTVPREAIVEVVAFLSGSA